MAVVNADDRAQLILITALVIAVIFVALAVVVNSAIFTDNLSTRHSGAESRDVIEQRATTDLSVHRALKQANAEHPNTDDVSVIESELEQLFDNQSAGILRDNARYGKVVDLQLTATTEGAHLRQVDQTRNFTAGGTNTGASDWRLVTGATDTDSFSLDLQENTLLNVSGDSANQLLDDADDTLLGGMLFHEAFHVEVTTPNGDTWRVYMFQGLDAEDRKKMYVYTQEPGEEIRTIEKSLDVLLDESCEASFEDGSAGVDIRAGTAGGESCQDLAFYEEAVVGTEYNISYRNAATDGLSDSSAQEIVDAFDEAGRISDLEDALETLLGINLDSVDSSDVVDAWEDAGLAGDRGTGTYDIVVDTPAEEMNFSDTSGPDPTRRVIVFSATIDTTYRTGGTSLLSTEVEIRWNGPHS